MEWTQRVLAVGEAFSGSECASLRTLVERQSGKFFRLYHHSNIEVRGWRRSSRASRSAMAAAGVLTVSQFLCPLTLSDRLPPALAACYLPAFSPPLTGAEQHA